MMAPGFDPIDAEDVLVHEEWQAGYWRGAQTGVWVGFAVGGAFVAAAFLLGRWIGS